MEEKLNDERSEEIVTRVSDYVILHFFWVADEASRQTIETSSFFIDHND